MKKLLLSKIEIAQRQLETAIELFFEERDEVSTNNLAHSSHQIIHDILENKEIISLKKYNFQNNTQGITEPKDFNKEYNKLWSFIKHADKDPDGILEFDTIINDLLIMTAIIDFNKLSNKLPEIMKIYREYFMNVCLDEKGMPPNDHALIDFNKRELEMKRCALLIKQFKVKNVLALEKL